jgi:putative oxidoreductase
MAAAAGLAELGGGAMLAAGFFTPLAAAMIAGTMLVAARTAHAGKGPWISNGGWEHVLTLAVVAVGLAVIGAGAWSLDAAIGWDVSGLWWGVGALLVALVGATDVLTIGRRGRKAPRAASSLSHRPG